MRSRMKLMTAVSFVSFLALGLTVSEGKDVLAEEPAGEYTIRFDLNTTPDISDDELYVYEETGYDENWQPVTEEKEAVFTVPAEENAFLDVSIPNPVREGYYFAGWQTRPVVEESDLIHGVSPYLWMMGEKFNPTGKAYLEVASEDEMSARQLINEVKPLSELESLDENGNGTLYARWVQVKEISGEEELRAIADDLYGAYELTADIELTGPWTPVGCYFQNYEYYETGWWTFAFRGTLLGNGHKILGLQVNGAAINSDDYRTEETAVVWNNDGQTCDGTAAMFGAVAGATIQDLTLENPVIDVSGDYAFDGEYCYASALAAFAMESSFGGIQINNADIRMDVTEESAVYRDSLYASAGCLAAGCWSSPVTNCSAGGSITLDAHTRKSHGGTVFLGGLIGECYSDMTGCTVDDMSLTLNGEDLSTAEEDTALQVTAGGLNGSNTNSSGNTVNANISVNVSKPVGASSINAGGYTGSQLYMTAADNTVNADITTDCTLDENQGRLNVGSVAGRIDIYYTLQILQYTPVAQSGTSGNTVQVTYNGEAVEPIIAQVPEVDGTPVGWINNGEYEIAEGTTVPSNIEAVIETYGSYVPQSSLMPGIIWITVE